MQDDELDMWREQWLAEPAVAIDLIQRVERETVQMRLGRLALFVPAALAAALTVLVAMKPNTVGVLFAAGLWLFMGILGWIDKRNMREMWSPASETPAAYLQLSIERCRRTERGWRIGRVLAVLLTAFVLFGVYELIGSAGALNTTVSYWIVAATFLWTICVVGSVLLFVQRRIVRKMRTELEYLLNLQNQLRIGQQGEN